jgi:hypothetical protein
MRESMEIYPRTAAERAMKLQEVSICLYGEKRTLTYLPELLQ